MDTSDRILISATRLFATRGFAHTSMPAIAKQSGITPGAIYRHFESKAQLLMEVVRYALRTLPAGVGILEPAELDAGDLPEYVASFTTNDYKLIRQLSLEIHAAAAREKDARAILSEVIEETAQKISRSLLAAQVQRTAQRNLDTYFTAIFLQAIILGLEHMETLQPNLIGNSRWHDFIKDRIWAILGSDQSVADKKDNDDLTPQPDPARERECSAPSRKKGEVRNEASTIHAPEDNQLVTTGRSRTGSERAGRRSLSQPGMLDQSYYRWPREYSDLKLEHAQRMKDLEKENSRLKKAIAELTLEKQILKEALEGNF